MQIKNSLHNVCLVFWQKRLTDARISSADLVHQYGLGLSLWRPMKARMSVSNCFIEVWNTATQLFSAELGESPFDLIDPRRRRWREVQMWPAWGRDRAPGHFGRRC